MTANYVDAIIDVCSGIFSKNDISGADNFFSLGGTSLDVVMLTNELMTRFRLELPLDAAFVSQDLAEMAQQCRRADEASPASAFHDGHEGHQTS
jgi:acyl carrier protein